ncbi:MAG TPA: hypothetical protein PLL78_01900 [Fimbriimonadaceae bacterium]|nr:hypothetical protein [Fimbriimonadaceae bacterium]HRJ95411.1 hypothetical protein [Fimbriimonadaceae bacterium]
MFSNKKTRLAVFAGLGAVAAVAVAAQSYAVFSGTLTPDHYREHVYKIGPGEWRVTAVNEISGDLDIEVYNESGRRIAWDVLPDNLPVASFSNSRTQLITVRVINASPSRAADYTGVIE